MALTEKHPHQLASFSWRIQQLPGLDWRTSPSNGTRHGRLPWDLVPATVIRWAPKKRYPAAGGCSRAPFTGGGFSDQIVAVRRLLVYTSSLAAAGICVMCLQGPLWIHLAHGFFWFVLSVSSRGKCHRWLPKYHPKAGSVNCLGYYWHHYSIFGICKFIKK